MGSEDGRNGAGHRNPVPDGGVDESGQQQAVLEPSGDRFAPYPLMMGQSVAELVQTHDRVLDELTAAAWGVWEIGCQVRPQLALVAPGQQVSRHGGLGCFDSLGSDVH